MIREKGVLHGPGARVTLLRTIGLCLLSCVLLGLPENANCTVKAEITVDLHGQGHTIDRRIFGQFLEHFGRIIQGGLWAELLQNRKFYPIDPDRTQVAEPWKPEADRSKVSYVIDRFEAIDGVSSERVSLLGMSRPGGGLANRDLMSWEGTSTSRTHGSKRTRRGKRSRFAWNHQTLSSRSKPIRQSRGEIGRGMKCDCAPRWNCIRLFSEFSLMEMVSTG